MSTFFDQTQLPPGLRWVVAIEQAIENSAAVAILVGPNGFGNTQHYEREMALVRQTRNAKFPVIPIILPGFEGQPSGFLELLTWIDFRGASRLLSQPDQLELVLAALRSSQAAAKITRIAPCPYMGLEPFREEDAIFFCGREDLISAIVGHVQSYGFVAVVGRSGSGKSSLVFAGLIPSLRNQRATIVWDVLSIRPGAWPLHALAEALSAPSATAGPAVRDKFIDDEAEALRHGGVDRLVRMIGRRLEAALEKPDRLLIYIDQWEELYAMAPPAEDEAACERHALDREAFISLLVGLSSNPRSRCRIIITVRADFYEHLIRNGLLSGLLPQQQVNIGPLLPVDLQAAIEKPASKTGLSFSPPELVQQILQDVGTDEGMLPLLQYALKETWIRREGSHLTADGYTAAGGVRGAIQSTAERTYLNLSAEEKIVARRLFLGLVRPGEGRDDTRARLPIPLDHATREIIQKFSDKRSRLLVTGSDNISPSDGTLQGHGARKPRATVEVAHEALIRNWPTLKEWLDINRDRLRARSAILQSKSDWEDSCQSDGALLTPGFQLDRARALMNDSGDVPLDDIADYIQRSVATEDRRLAEKQADELENQRRIAEAERQAREAAELATREALSREATEYRARRAADKAANTLRWWLAVVVFAGVAAVGALIAAAAARKAAIYNLQASFLTNAEQSLIEQRPAAARALSLSGISNAPTFWSLDRFTGSFFDDPVSEERAVRLRSIAGLTQSASLMPIGSWKAKDAGVLVSAAISPDGTQVAFGDARGVVHVEPVSTGGEKFKLTGHRPGRILSLAFAGSSTTLVSATATEIVVWDTQARRSRVICNNSSSSITEVDVDPKGQYVAWSSKDGTVSRRSISPSAGPPQTFQDHSTAMAISISPDGRSIASVGDEGKVVVRKVSGDEKPITIVTARADVISVALNITGTQVAVASLSGPVEVWKVAEGPQQPTLVAAPADKRWKVRYSADGRWLVVASWRQTLGFWDADQLTYAGTLDGHRHRVNDLAFSKNSGLVVTASESGVGRLWRIDEIWPIFRETKPSDAGENIVGAYNADGTLFAAGGKDGIARLYRVGSLGELSLLCSTEVQTERIIGVSFLPGENLLATVRLAERNLKTLDVIKFWSADDCGQTSKFRDEDKESIGGFNFDTRNSILAWGNASGKIALLPLAPGGERGWMQQKPAEGHSESIANLAFSADGEWLASAGNDGVLAIWNVKKRTFDHRKSGPRARLNTVQFSPDGRFVAAGGEDPVIYIWDRNSREPARVLSFPGQTNRLAFSPDSSMLAAGSDDRQLSVWSTSDWKKTFQLNKLVGVRSVYGFHPKRNDLAFDGENGVIRVIPAASLQSQSGHRKTSYLPIQTEIDFDAGPDHTFFDESPARIDAAPSCN